MRAAAAESRFEAFLRFTDKPLQLIARDAPDGYSLTLSLKNEKSRGLIARNEKLLRHPLLVCLCLFQQALGFHFRWFKLGGGHRD